VFALFSGVKQQKCSDVRSNGLSSLSFTPIIAIAIDRYGGCADVPCALFRSTSNHLLHLRNTTSSTRAKDFSMYTVITPKATLPTHYASSAWLHCTAIQKFCYFCYPLLTWLLLSIIVHTVSQTDLNKFRTLSHATFKPFYRASAQRSAMLLLGHPQTTRPRFMVF